MDTRLLGNPLFCALWPVAYLGIRDRFCFFLARIPGIGQPFFRFRMTAMRSCFFLASSAAFLPALVYGYFLFPTLGIVSSLCSGDVEFDAVAFAKESKPLGADRLGRSTTLDVPAFGAIVILILVRPAADVDLLV